MANVPQPPEGHVPVSIWEVTPHMLREWGFPVRGHHITHDEWAKGEEFGIARHKAVVAGWIDDLAPKPDSWGEPPTMSSEALADWWSILRPEDRERYIKNGLVG